MVIIRWAQGLHSKHLTSYLPLQGGAPSCKQNEMDPKLGCKSPKLGYKAGYDNLPS